MSGSPNPPLRVLVAAQQLRRDVPGGIGQYASGLLDGIASLDRSGCELTLYASRPDRRLDGAGRPDPLEEFGLTVRSSVLPGPLLTRAWDHGLVHAPKGFDLVHSVSLAAPPTRHHVPAVITIHDLAWRKNPEATTRRGRTWHERALVRSLARARAFIVSSPTVAHDLLEAGAPPDVVTTVPPGCDHLAAPDHEAARRLLEERGVRGGYLLSVGTLEPRKNLARLVAAFELARPSFPEPWKLVVVGPSGWGDVRRSVLGTRPGPGDAIVSIGRVSAPELAGLYAGARLLAYVPLDEGYGLPPLEAASLAVPVVASSGVPSVVPDENTPKDTPRMLQVDPLDTRAIARALIEVAGDEQVRRTLIQAGLTLARSRSWAAAAAAHLEVWRRFAR